MKELQLKIGQAVWSSRQGLGVVEDIVGRSSYPVRVRFPHIDSPVQYTPEGKYLLKDIFPELAKFDPDIHQTALKVDDPIVIIKDNRILRRNFAKWSKKGQLKVFDNGKDSWTFDTIETYCPDEWRMPTKLQLEDIYDGSDP